MRYRGRMAPNTENLRCAVVGVGRMGRHHARVYTQIPGCSLAAVVDADADRRGAIAEQFGCREFATVDDMLSAGVTPGAVSVAVPTTHHVAAARPLLTRGVACLIEKPLANTQAEALELKTMAEHGGAALMVGHIERYNPAVRALHRQTAGAGGGGGKDITPRFIEVHRVSPMTFRSVDVGVVLDMMIHDIDLVLSLVSGDGPTLEPDDIQASAVSVVTEHEDVCNARLTWNTPRGRTVANITASRLALKTERKCRIVAEDAYVSIDYAAKAGVVIRKTANAAQLGEVRQALRDGKDLSSLDYSKLVALEPLAVDEAEPLRLEIQDFVGAVRSGRRPPIDADAGFANVRTANRIVEAARAS